MYIEIDTIIQFAGLLTALITIIGALAVAVRWFDRQKQQDTEIKELKHYVRNPISFS